MRIYKPVGWLASVPISKSLYIVDLTPVIFKTFWSIYSRWEWTRNLILSGSESFAGTLELIFHMKIDFLGGTVIFQVGLCTPLWSMPLTWMFYRRSLNNSLDHIHDSWFCAFISRVSWNDKWEKHISEKHRMSGKRNLKNFAWFILIHNWKYFKEVTSIALETFSHLTLLAKIVKFETEAHRGRQIWNLIPDNGKNLSWKCGFI